MLDTRSDALSHSQADETRLVCLCFLAARDFAPSESLSESPSESLSEEDDSRVDVTLFGVALALYFLSFAFCLAFLSFFLDVGSVSCSPADSFSSGVLADAAFGVRARVSWTDCAYRASSLNTMEVQATVDSKNRCSINGVRWVRSCSP